MATVAHQPAFARHAGSIGGLGCIALLLFPPPALRAQTAYRIGPPPPWVHPLAVDLSAPPPAGRVTNGYEMLLVDRQESVGLPGVERFRHVAYRLLDESAVQEYSQIELVFDPSYERLTLHAVTVVRNGRTMNQLKADRIRVAQRETEMDYQVIDGSLSLVLLLEDVQPGDVVEYSYTRSGLNPVFAGHYMTRFSLEETVPLRRLEFRLLWPHDRPLFVRRYQTAVEPSMTATGPYREYVWAERDVPPKVLEPDLPEWYDPMAEIQLSDFASWRQVAAWGDTLFASTDPVPRALAARLARIRATHASQEERTLAALRFVQDQVRYLGVEIGVNSHRPYPPATVLQRGYGDCKDKVLLLVTMLRALGVPAWPALVSTQYAGRVRDFHPTAGVFDHAIVRADVQGRTFWLDPTELHQRGDLESSTPGFGTALVLGRAVDSLSPVRESPTIDPLTDVFVTLELGDVGAPSKMVVDTRYRGRAADGMRASIRKTSVEELQRRYTDFYAQVYPAVRSEALPDIRDDEANNVVWTTERYSIPDFWHPAANQKGDVGTFDPLELDRVIPSSTGSSRTMPLSVDHPTHVRYTIEAHMKEGWNIVSRADTIETAAARFVRNVQVRGQTLTLSYEYETLADHVLPASAADYLDKMARVRRLLTFTITPPRKAATLAAWSDPHEVNWPVLLTGLFATGLAVFGAVQVQRATPPAWPRGPDQPNDGPAGLGGWLILVGIGVSLTPLRVFAGLLKTAPTYTASSWSQLTTLGTPSYHPLWAPTLLLEMVFNVWLLVFTCLQVFLFFRRRRWFPALFVILAGARVTFDWLDALLANEIPTIKARGIEWSTHVATLLILAIWVAYMFRSRRVQNTFVT